MVEVPLWPWTNERLVGFALMEKSSDGGAAVTVKLTEVLCVALAAVPVTVRVYVPGVAVPAPTVSVEAPPAVTEVGLRVAVAPAGVPLTVRSTVSAVPLVTAVEMADVPFAPCARERLAGLALIEKSFATAVVIVKVTVVLCVALAPVPVTVIVYVPAAAVPAPSVSVELPPAVTDAGLNEAVAPEGRPLALSETVCAEPLVTAVAMVEVALPFCVAETELGLALIEKSFVTPQPGSLNVPIRVLQLNAPFAGMYSFAYQKVHPSAGSIPIEV